MRLPPPVSSSSGRTRRRSPPWATRSNRRRPPRAPTSRPCPAISASSKRTTRRSRSPNEIGYPVMIKASAGGGGKGMRIAIQQVRGGGEFRPRPFRSEIEFWRRPRLHREIHHRPAPYRNPSAGRQARQRRLSRRARMLDPAPQPESHRGSAVAAARPGDAGENGRAGGRAGQGRRLRLGRHGRVRRRPGQELLFPGDEHAAAGRASGDGIGHRHRSGRADDPRRRRRKTRASRKAT